MIIKTTTIFINILKNNLNLIFGFTLYTTIGILIAFYNHHYYDDEIFNLTKLSWSLTDIIENIQHEDVHPPLSYILNKIIFDAFSSYKAILIFSVFLNAISLTYFFNFAENLLPDRYSKTLLFIFVFLNCGISLWTCSVRWYAYWIPLFIILYTYLLKQQKLELKNIVFITIVLVIMTYINYLTFLVILTIILFFILFKKRNITLKKTATFLITYSLLTSYQVCIFLKIHSHNKDSQIASITESIMNAIYGIINGGSIFITDPMLIIFSLLTFLIIIKNVNKKTLPEPLNQSIFFLLCLMSIMILTGISGKFRNNVALSIPFYFIITYFISTYKNTPIKKIYLTVTILTAFTSTINLISHTNTGKNSYNLPMEELADFLHPPQNKIIFSYDITTTFYLEDKGFKVLNPVNTDYNFDNREIYLIETNQGSLTYVDFKKALNTYDGIINKYTILEERTFGRDKYYNLKNLLRGKKPEVREFLIKTKHFTPKK